MARTLIVVAPSGITGATFDVIDFPGDTLLEAVSLTEQSTALGIYTGTLTAASTAGDHVGILKNGSGDLLGTFTSVRVLAVDPEEVWVRDESSARDSLRVEDSTFWQNTQSSTDTPVLITRTPLP